VTRESKSQELARLLESRAKTGKVNVVNPWVDEMESAAKHIRFLELICTGLTYADKQTIAKLVRRKKALETRLVAKDEKIKELKSNITEMKKMLKRELDDAHKYYDERIAELKEYKVEETNELREAIEREFIKRLLTTRQVKKLKSTRDVVMYQLQKDRWDGRMYYATDTATTY